MKKQILTSAFFAGTLAAGIFAQAESAQAASITYNFQAFPPSQAPPSFTVDGVTVDVSANVGAVSQSSNGLGITTGINDDRAEIDEVGPDEALEFDFGDVLIESLVVTFGRVGLNDQYQLFADGISVGSGDIPGGNINDNDQGSLAFSLSAPSSVFSFETLNANDDYSIVGFTVETFETIPTPALLPGLLGMGAAALRKRRHETAEAKA